MSNTNQSHLQQANKDLEKVLSSTNEEKTEEQLDVLEAALDKLYEVNKEVNGISDLIRDLRK
jgi:phage-related tail protein